MTMLIAFIYLAVTIAVAFGSYRVGVRAGSIQTIRRRNELPSVVCESCGGDWQKWGPVQVDRRPKDDRYPLTGGVIETRIQSRACTSCGKADLRVLA